MTTTPHTIRGHSLLEYKAPEDWKATNAIILPSQSVMRKILKDKGTKLMEVGDTPPDVYRWGKYVSGRLGISSDSFVYFNRHDAEEFEYEGVTYFRINNLNALAYYNPPEASPVY